jgi:thioredoxin-related protein
LDEESSLAESYGVVGVPTFVFVDAKGIVSAVEHVLPEGYERFFGVGKR